MGVRMGRTRSETLSATSRKTSGTKRCREYQGTRATLKKRQDRGTPTVWYLGLFPSLCFWTSRFFTVFLFLGTWIDRKSCLVAFSSCTPSTVDVFLSLRSFFFYFKVTQKIQKTNSIIIIHIKICNVRQHLKINLFSSLMTYNE